MHTKKLYRSQTDKVLAGVAGGIGEYFEVDPTIIRLLFVLITVMGGAGVLLYIIMWLIMPVSSNGHAIINEEKVKEFAQEVKDKAQDLKQDWQKKHEVAKSDKKDSNFFGWLLIILGGIFLVWNFTPAWFSSRIIYYWPVAIIFIGLYLIVKKK